jgi:putative PIN family toxin of toxin-antitoxin system
MLSVVFDTNIFISVTLAPLGLPATAFTAWKDGQFVLIVCPTILSEIRNTLGYARIRRKYAISDEIVETLIELLDNDAVMVLGDAVIQNVIPADPSDEAILACAVDGQADLIVSGDRHLLDLVAFRGIPIITVRTFLEQLDMKG